MKRQTREEFIEKAVAIHGDKYDYSEVVYINNHTGVKIFCKKCEEYFMQKPSNHLGCKTDCPFCSGCRVSKISQEYLDFYNVKKEYREKKIIINKKIYFLDSYEPNLNLAREVDGDFWHGNPNKYNQNDIHPIRKVTYGQLYKETLEKHAAIRSIGIELITIWETDWKKFKKSNNIK